MSRVAQVLEGDGVTINPGGDESAAMVVPLQPGAGIPAPMSAPPFAKHTLVNSGTVPLKMVYARQTPGSDRRASLAPLLRHLVLGLPACLAHKCMRSPCLCAHTPQLLRGEEVNTRPHLRPDGSAGLCRLCRSCLSMRAWGLRAKAKANSRGRASLHSMG